MGHTALVKGEFKMIHAVKKGFVMIAMSAITLSTVAPGALAPAIQVEAATTTTKIQLNRTKKNLRPGKKFELLVTDQNGKKISASKLSWSSSNKKIATVSSKGVVKAVKKGNATITAKLKGTSKKVYCKITVYNIKNSLELSHANMTLTVGDSETLGVDICRVDQTSTNPSWVTFTSSNSSVASVDAKGKVKAKKAGTATITAKLKKTYKTATCKVTVKKKAVATTAKKATTTTAKKTTTTTAKKTTTTTAKKTTTTTGSYRTLYVKTTAYCNCTICNGSWAWGPTASGVMPQQGRTIAVDKSVIPLGSKVEIDGHIYTAEDTGVKGNSIDIFFSSHSVATNYGVKYKTVKVYNK